jgi:beta-N-acetylhexosaminidase
MIDLESTTLSPDERALLREYQPKGICLFRRNFASIEQSQDLTATLRDLCGDALLISTDQEGGSVVRALFVPHSPGNMALGAVGDVAVTRASATITARGLQQLGVNVNLAPVADVNNNPHNPVIGDRSFGSDPEAVSEHVTAFVSGLQAGGIAATLKHFPGHGNTAVDSHHGLPEIDRSRKQLAALELRPFRAGIKAGAAGVMTFHGMLPKLDPDYPATLSKIIMTGLLRQQLGFDGVVFSDALEMAAIAKNYSAAEATLLALNAGVDMPNSNAHNRQDSGGVRYHRQTFDALAQAEHNGQIDPALLSLAAKRLERLAQRFPVPAHPINTDTNTTHNNTINTDAINTDETDTDVTDSDTRYLAAVSQRAVTTVASWGDITAIDLAKPILLVAADNRVGGSASDVIDTPARVLTTKLEQANFTVRSLFYQPDTLPDLTSINQNMADCQLLFVSASRHRLSAAEGQFAQQLAQQTHSAVHIALWNPYSCAVVGLPAVVSFGFAAAGLEQVIAVLTGTPAQGRLPIALV